MPMVDYLCSQCDYRWEEFHHSSIPATRPCPRLLDSDSSPTGSVPCNTPSPRFLSMPGEYRPSSAQRFAPILIFQSTSDPNKFSYPGRNDDPCPAGFRPISISNIREADHWTRKIDSIEGAKARDQLALNDAYFDQTRKDRREKEDCEAERRGMNSDGLNRLLRDKMRAYTDRKREVKRRGAPAPNFHIQALSFDSSNRQGHASAETGWKDRKA